MSACNAESKRTLSIANAFGTALRALATSSSYATGGWHRRDDDPTAHSLAFEAQVPR